MRILLVRPPRIKQSISLGEFMYSEPIGLEMIYALLEDTHHVQILDLMSECIAIEDTLREYRPDVVGITSLCIDVHAVRSLAGRVKKYDEKIITLVGGTQTYLNPGAFFRDSIDHVMKYTTRKNINVLFDCLSKDENPPLIDCVHSKSNGFTGTGLKGVNEYIHPHRVSTQKYRKNYSYFGYKPCAIMGTAQGCSKQCKFCLRWRIEGCSEHYFPMDFVKSEIRGIQENSIMIFDNDFLHNKDRLQEFCDFLEEEKITKNFICYGSVHSILNHKEIIKRFKALGLQAVLVGYESFSDDELKEYQKKSTVEDNILASKFLKEIQLDVWASFMIHPDWSRSDFQSFRKYLRNLNPEISSFSPLTPFPNLPMYHEYEERLLVDKENYPSWSFGQVTIMPSKMDLRQYYYEILKTNLYVNLFPNNILYMVKKFGFSSVLRLMKGSIYLFFKYVKLMVYGV